jgi:hypothetical protein
VEYSFIGEFDLLRESRRDVRTEDWAQPARREATVTYLRLKRAREEIIRLNVEIRRLRTYIHDETLLMEKTIQDLSATNVPLARQLAKQWSLRSQVNAVNLGRLDRIEAFPEFSGIHGVGRRLNHGTPVNPSVPAEDTTMSLVLDNVVEEILAGEMGLMVIREDDEVLNDIQGVTDFVSTI